MSDMALLDLMVDANFRSKPDGRVVIFPGGRRHRGYVVNSAAEELKIKSFLKMFYFAQLSTLLLGYFLASESSMELCYALGRPARHLVRTGGIVFGIYSLVLGLPYWSLWRSYKKTFMSFVSAQDEVVISEGRASQRRWIVSVGLIALASLVLLGAMFIVRATSVAN
jgi:hypothetical protein